MRMSVLKILNSAATSVLLFSASSHAFALATPRSFTSTLSTKVARTVTSLSSMSSTEAVPIPFPVAHSAAPGTSDIESQDVLNPINKTCTILVIGGSRGIGLEFVRQCASKGATVFATYRSEDPPEELSNLQKEYPDITKLIRMDLADEASIQNAANSMKEMKSTPPLTHIIHSAGVYFPGASFDGTARGPRNPAPPVTKEIMMKTFEINTIAPLLIAQNFVPLMGKRSDTLLPVLAILTSKVGSIDDNGSGGAYAYRSSKSALNNIAKSLSVDLAGEARVALLHPGYVRTDMTGGNGLIDVDESVGGMLKAVEATDATTSFRFVDYKACLIPW